jgi:beta-galactosidase/beta-glucuronidase
MPSPSAIAPVSSTALDEHGRGYPRPQLQRREWVSLNGRWDFAADDDRQWSRPSQVAWNETIVVPFAPEAPASGIGRTGYLHACWYRRAFPLAPPRDGHRWLLHFGAVDCTATVWVNGSWLGVHEGGYTPFSFDITELAAGDTCEVIVHVADDPHDLAKPRGKQDWQLEAHSIWYPRTTGIWQSVWLEEVPKTRIARVAYTPDLARWEIGLDVWIETGRREDLRLAIKLRNGATLLAADTYRVMGGEVHRGVALSDPGIDDSRNELLWSPHSPKLLDVDLELWGERGDLIDSVHSYTALRSASTSRDRFELNGRPYLLRMVLDQGYWPDSGLTAPNDAALRRDVELARRMGFNGVRKHQKIEDPRYLYWADVIGLTVWEEMPSAYRFTQRSVERLSREWTAIVQRDYSHPCIVSWVPINESWGVPNLPSNARERHYVEALYHLTKTLDPTRPVIGNDGWEAAATDIIGIHDYDDQPHRIGRRYRADDVLPRLFKRERPGGRILVLEGTTHADMPLMLSEFGGIALKRTDDKAWGYSVCQTPEELTAKYEQLLSVVRNLGLLAGFCYTQFADTYQEANGLLFADRTPKIPLSKIAAATAGPGAVRSDGWLQVVEGTDPPVEGQ